MKKLLFITLIFLPVILSAQDTLCLIQNVTASDTTICRSTLDGAGNFFAINYEETDVAGDTVIIYHKIEDTYAAFSTESLKTMSKTTPTYIINNDSIYNVSWRIDYTTKQNCYKYYKYQGTTGPLILYQE